MSRRTRIKRDIRRPRFGLNHHNQYSSSQTYFPSSYSLNGSPIKMPQRLLNLSQNNKINYVCQPQQLLSSLCPLQKLPKQQLQSAQQVNITVAGRIIQQYCSVITKCVFLISLSLCCALCLFANKFFRRRFYTRYATSIQQYQILAELIKKMISCQNLIINIQDNELNKQKAQVIENAVLKSLQYNNSILLSDSDQIHKNTNKNRKKVTIRNLCYFMDDVDYKQLFKKLTECQQIDVVFIWEKKKIRSIKCGQKDGETQSLLNPILDC